MNERAAIVLASAALLGLMIYLYFSPFQQCVRAVGDKSAAVECVTRIGGIGR